MYLLNIKMKIASYSLESYSFSYLIKCEMHIKHASYGMIWNILWETNKNKHETQAVSLLP